MSPSTCVIYSRHPALMRSLKSIVEPDIEVVAMADNVVSLLAAMEKLQPSVMLMSLSTLDRSDVDSARHLIRRCAKVLFVAIIDNLSIAEQMLGMGVRGCVAAERAAIDLVPAIRSVLDGEVFVSPSP